VSFKTWSAFRTQLPIHLADSGKVFTVKMEHELVKHFQDKNAKFYGLTKKDFVLKSFKISDLNGLNHTHTRTHARARARAHTHTHKVSGKDWVREFSRRHGLAVHTSNTAAWTELLDLIDCSARNVFLRIYTLKIRKHRKGTGCSYQCATVSSIIIIICIRH